MMCISLDRYVDCLLYEVIIYVNVSNKQAIHFNLKLPYFSYFQALCNTKSSVILKFINSNCQINFVGGLGCKHDLCKSSGKWAFKDNLKHERGIDLVHTRVRGMHTISMLPITLQSR